MKPCWRLSPAAAVAVITLATTSAQACTACMGDPDSKFAEATNAAIFLMLGVLGGVFGLLSVFAIYLHRRSLAPLPPHAEVGDVLDSSSEGASS